jgi:hypothetical protein
VQKNPSPSDERWLTTQQLADRLNIPVTTIRDWRLKGYGPKGTKLGRGRSGAVRYRLSAVVAWERGQEQIGGAA